MRIACWSGPRNISTALMRSWSSRKDSFVSDEPLYAYYLKKKQLKHPMYKEIINHYSNKRDNVIKKLTSEIPNGKKYSIKTYNAVLFNTESVYREKNFLIPKICLSAIEAYKLKKKTSFGNLDIKREWNWCDEQVKYILKFIEKKPQDFLLSNQRIYSAPQMLSFAFEYFNLDYKKYILHDKKYIRPNDFKTKSSNSQSGFEKNIISYNYKIYGKKILNKIIKYYWGKNCIIIESYQLKKHQL